MLTKEQEDLLNELEKLTTELEFPAAMRRNWRWIKKHSCFLTNTGSDKLEHLLQLVNKLEFLSHDCVFIPSRDRE